MKKEEDHKALELQTALGQKVLVQREDKKSEVIERQNKVLKDIGRRLQEEDEALKNGFEYKGSIAAHVYVSPITQTLVMIDQVSTLLELPEVMAPQVVQNLRGSLMEAYGQVRQKKRSGF